MKAIISAGGRSERIKSLAEIYGGKIFLPLNGKPLLAYQIESLVRLGVNEICLTITSEETKKVFNRLLNERKLPNLIYSFILKEYGGNALFGISQKDVINFIKEGPIWLTHGDLFYTDLLLRNILKRFESKVALVGLVDKLRSHHLFGFRFNKFNKVTSIIKRDKLHEDLLNLTEPLLFNKKALVAFIDSLTNKPLNYLSAFRAVLRKGEIVGLQSKVANINTLEEYRDLIQSFTLADNAKS